MIEIPDVDEVEKVAAPEGRGVAPHADDWTITIDWTWNDCALKQDPAAWFGR